MAERPFPLRVRSGAAEAECLEIELDLRERRTQLVRHTRNEIGLQPGELALAPQLRDRGDGERCGETEQSEEEREPRRRSAANDKRSRDFRPNDRIDGEGAGAAR